MKPLRPLAIFAILLGVFSVIARFCSIELFLPYYSLDENELTEYALMLFGQDKDPHWYKYGPLYWYWLHWVYEIQASFSGLSGDQFVERYFIEPVDYFLASRYLATFLHIGISAVAGLFAFKHFGRTVGWLTLSIVIFPFSDTLTSFLPRIDTLLGFCVICCLFFAAFLLKKEVKQPTRYFALMAAFFAMSVAAKPIPSLLIAPSLLLVFLIYHMGGEFTISKLPQAFIKIFSTKYLYLFLAVGIVVFYISNPYAFKSFDLFWAEQVQAVQSEGDRGFRSGADLLRFNGNLGILFILLSVGATLWSLYDGIKNGVTIPLVLGSYGLVYWGLFAMGAARDYFYVPLVPVWALLMGYYVSTLLQRLTASSKSSRVVDWIAITFVIALIAQPLYGRIWPRVMSDQTIDNNSQRLATDWIYQNIPPQSSILYYGYYTSLPHLIDPNLNELAQYSDHFMYGRGKNQYWIDRFVKGHQDLFKSGKAKPYDIQYNLNMPNGARPYYTRYEDDGVSENIFSLAKQQGAKYICSVYEITDKSGGYVLLKEFSRSNSESGPRIWIYTQR